MEKLCSCMQFIKSHYFLLQIMWTMSECAMNRRFVLPIGLGLGLGLGIYSKVISGTAFHIIGLTTSKN